MILLLLLQGQRMNSAYFFTENRMAVAEIGVIFLPNYVLKHSEPGRKLDSFHYRAYHKKRLCVADCLKEYLKRRNTKVQTHTKALLIIYDKTFRVAAIDSMRWVKELFIETSILKEYAPHSCISAVSSETSHLSLDIAKILKQSCWKNAKTFFHFYKKDIVYYPPCEYFNMKYSCR